MSCDEVTEILCGAKPAGPEVASHLESCAACRSLAGAFQTEPKPVNTAVLDRVKTQVLGAVAPVRPMPTRTALSLAMFVIFAVVAVAGGFLLRMDGVRALTPVERAVIFSAVGLAALAASTLTASEMIPGSARMRARTLFAALVLAIEAVFLVVFRNYSMGRFVPQGVACLIAGLVCALPAALLVLLVVRRGAVLQRASAGAAIGMVSGLAGLAALELHCPILLTWHVAVWHVAVVVIATAVGALIGAVVNRGFRPASSI